MRKISILMIMILAGTMVAAANIKVKTKQTMSGQSYENTTYIKGKRQRTETMNGMTVNLTQCDLRRAIQMNPATKTFLINEFGDIEPATGSVAAKASATSTIKGGRIVTTMTVKDTGERKQMFGYTARHLLITMDTESTPDACSPNKSKMEMDGWYIDFDNSFDCDQTYAYQKVPSSKGGCQDKYEFKTIGTGKRGFALYEKMTFFDASGKESMSMVSEVVELSKATLDSSLFEVPDDYKQVTDMSQLYAAGGGGANLPLGSTKGSAVAGQTSSSMPLPSASSVDTSNSGPGPKRAGVVRIGLAQVKTGAVGDGITANDLAAAVQNTFTAFLKMPNIEIVPIEARLSSGILAEAKEKECDVILSVTASHKKGGGGGFGKMLGSIAAPALSSSGLGAAAGVGGMVAASVASSAIHSAASMSGSMKAKDEITIDVKLDRMSGQSALAQQFKAKAKSSGEDIISQAIERASEAIVAALAGS